METNYRKWLLLFLASNPFNPFFENIKSFSKIPSSTLRKLFPIIEKEAISSKLEMMEIIVPVDRSKAKITLKTKEIGHTPFA